MTEQEFWDIMAAIPEPQPLTYRLYHDDQGLLLFYSMDRVPGNYIEITAKQFHAGATNVRVKDGQLVTVKFTTTTVLDHSDHGVPCHPDNVAIVVTTEQEHQCWSKRTYEQN